MPAQAEKLANFKKFQFIKNRSNIILRMRPVKNIPITETDESSNVHSGIYLLPH
jgi:hypothetical protein